MNIVGAWKPGDPEPDRHIGWVRAAYARMHPHGTGVYTNFLSDEGTVGVERAYGDRLKRLTALKGFTTPTTSSA